MVVLFVNTFELVDNTATLLVILTDEVVVLIILKENTEGNKCKR